MSCILYDELDRITGVTIDTNTSPSYTYEYGANGHAARVTDAKLGRTVETEYDLADRPCRSTIKDTSGNTIYRSTLRYDKLSNLKQLREEMNNGANGTRVTNFTYDRDNRITRTQYGGSTNYRVDYAYDALGRLTTRTAANGSNSYATSYTYVSGGYGTNSTTPLISGITQTGMNFTYAYDSRGNITSETRNGSTTTYVYDGIGQLTRVNDPHENATWVYNYDQGGNITSKVKYAYTTGTLGTAVQTIPYTYDSTWKDKLAEYNGTTITYDAIGNPLNDGTWSYTWEKGRQLVKMVNDDATVTFKYDHNGLRTEKYVKQNGTETTTKYIYSGTRLVHMTQGSNWLHFFYDGSGQPAEMNFNGTVYIYVKNLQGDIVGIVDTTGRIVVEYKYDAWGRPTYSISLVDSNSTLTARYALMLTLNPFRYRGYVWDDETYLYYLRSRMYNPIICRYISEDSIVTHNILGKNIYCYCFNCSESYSDFSGLFALPTFLTIGGAIIGAVVGFASSIISDCINERPIDIGNALKEGVKGAISGVFKPWLISSAVSFTLNTVDYCVEASNNNEPIEGTVILMEAVTTIVSGTISEGAFGDAKTTIDYVISVAGDTMLSTGSTAVVEHEKETAATKRKNSTNNKTANASDYSNMPRLATRWNSTCNKLEEYVIY